MKLILGEQERESVKVTQQDIENFINKTKKVAEEYYGEEYKDVIEENIEKTIFLPLGKNYTFKDAVDFIESIDDLGRDCNKDDINFEIVGGMQVSNIKVMGKDQSFVIFEEKDLKKLSILIHEFWGHGVTNCKAKLVKDSKTGEMYERNGLITQYPHKIKFTYLNEAAIEFITNELCKKLKINKQKTAYDDIYPVIRNLIKIIGRKQLIDYMVAGIGDVETSYDGDLPGELEKLDILLGKIINEEDEWEKMDLYDAVNNNLELAVRRKK